MTASKATADSAPSMALVVFWLASGTFAIGCGEFAAMSLLPYFAADFGITEASAGGAVSLYALGVVIGAPTIAVFASRYPPKRVLVALMALFAVGNGLSVVAPTPLLLDVARFIAGIPHGAYFGIAMLFAADIAAPHRRSLAVSQVMMGIAISNILGVPVVTAIGQALGWRAGFAVVAALAALTMVMVQRVAPALDADPAAHPLSELKALTNRDVLLTLSMGAVGFGGMFAVYSYFSAAYLATTDAPEWTVSVALLAYGFGTTAGSALSGWVSGTKNLWAALGFQIVLGVAAGIYAIAVGNPWAMGATMFIVGIGGGLVVPLQTRLMDVAGEAQTLAAAMNHAAFNVANALGPWAAGMALEAGLGWSAPGWVGIGLAGGGLAMWGLMVLSDRARARASSVSEPLEPVLERAG